MKRTIFSLGSIVMVAMMFMISSVSASPLATPTSDGSLIIYAYACPTGFTGEDYESCRATPLGGVGYTGFAAGQDNGVGATTDADGSANLSLAAIGGGTVNIVVRTPGGYESTSVACSQEHGAIDTGITFANLATDAFVTCEWYFVSTGDEPGTDEDGSLTIQKYACAEAGDNVDYAACREQPQAGTGFTVFAAGTDNGVGGTTDENGVASFPLFAADLPGDIGIYEEIPQGYNAFDVQCTDAAGELVNYVPNDTGVTLLGVQEGADLTCEWFNVSADDGGTDPTPTATGADPTPAPTVSGLPNTGVGTGNPGNDTSGLVSTGAIMGLIGVGLIIAWRRQLCAASPW